MRKLLIKIGLLVLLYGSTTAQSRLGFSPDEIMEDMPQYEFKTAVTDAGMYYIHCTTPRLVCMYFFNNDMKCITTVALPLNNAVLNAFVEKYNKEFVIIDDHRWLWYSDDGSVIKVNLRILAGETAFVFTY